MIESAVQCLDTPSNHSAILRFCVSELFTITLVKNNAGLPQVLPSQCVSLQALWLHKHQW
jgi:hypothetical protein